MARDMSKLHPCVRMLAEQLVANCAAAGLNVKVTDCVRTKEEQNGIDASRTGVKYPYSYHNWGLAFDVCQNDKSCAYPSDNNWWKKVGKIGKDLGLEWGGDWTSPVDRPHFQLDTYGTCVQLVKKYGTPEKFWKHDDYKISTPKLPIKPNSLVKKIIWLQTRLNCNGAHLVVDGIYGANTKRAVQIFWMKKTGKECTGDVVSTKCIKLLA